MPTRIHRRHIPTGELGKPPINPPTIVIQDNVKYLAFTVGTDRVFYIWEVPLNFAGGDLDVQVHWTNDGGVDDLNKDVKVQLDYQVVSDGDPGSGSHANSPKAIEDTYLSAAGWIRHTTGVITIAEADFFSKHEIELKISFVAPAGVILTCEPHLSAMMLRFREYILK